MAATYVSLPLSQLEMDLALTEALCPAVLTVSQVLCVTFDHQLDWVRASGLSEANIWGCLQMSFH